MKNQFRLLLILTVIISAGFGCKYLKHGETALSEQADSKPAATVKTSRLTLNDEPLGSLDDLDPLAAKIRLTMQARESDAIFKAGSNEIENTVYLRADPRISIGKIAQLSRAISGGGGYLFEREPYKKTHAVIHFPIDRNQAAVPTPQPADKFNGTLLVIKTENAPPASFPDSLLSLQDMREISATASFETIESSNELVATRALNSHIEISADDNFFFNNKMEKAPRSNDEAKLDQRPINETELRFDLNKLYTEVTDRNNKETGQLEIYIIASENASHASLLKLFAAIDRPYVRVMVKVRPTVFQKE